MHGELTRRRRTLTLRHDASCVQRGRLRSCGSGRRRQVVLPGRARPRAHARFKVGWVHCSCTGCELPAVQTTSRLDRRCNLAPQRPQRGSLWRTSGKRVSSQARVRHAHAVRGRDLEPSQPGERNASLHLCLELHERDPWLGLNHAHFGIPERSTGERRKGASAPCRSAHPGNCWNSMASMELVVASGRPSTNKILLGCPAAAAAAAAAPRSAAGPSSSWSSLGARVPRGGRAASGAGKRRG